MSLYGLSGFSTGYNSQPVIREIGAELEAGAVTALIGPNGSGKSTLLRALAGLSEYEGSLTLFGREVSRITRREFGRLAGFLPQNTNVGAEFSVYDVIALGRLPYRGPLERLSRQDDRIILESAEEAEVGELLFRRLPELSGGERQRVLFAMTLAQRPEVFLLDEPTSALDPANAKHLFAMLAALAAKGKSIVAAIHDINGAVSGCSRFVALKEGRILAAGATEEINGDILRELYGIGFARYSSKEGRTAWQPE